VPLCTTDARRRLKIPNLFHGVTTAQRSVLGCSKRITRGVSRVATARVELPNVSFSLSHTMYVWHPWCRQKVFQDQPAMPLLPAVRFWWWHLVGCPAPAAQAFQGIMLLDGGSQVTLPLPCNPTRHFHPAGIGMLLVTTRNGQDQSSSSSSVTAPLFSSRITVAGGLMQALSKPAHSAPACKRCCLVTVFQAQYEAIMPVACHISSLL